MISVCSWCLTITPSFLYSVVGLGAMGLPIAANLAAGAAAGAAPVQVYDLNAAAVAEAEAAGCSGVSDVNAAVLGADVIVSSLPRSSDVLAVVQSMLSTSSDVFVKGAIWVDTTSGEPKVSRQISDLLGTVDVHYLDAGAYGHGLCVCERERAREREIGGRFNVCYTFAR